MRDTVQDLLRTTSATFNASSRKKSVAHNKGKLNNIEDCSVSKCACRPVPSINTRTPIQLARKLLQALFLFAGDQSGFKLSTFDHATGSERLDLSEEWTDKASSSGAEQPSWPLSLSRGSKGANGQRGIFSALQPLGAAHLEIMELNVICCLKLSFIHSVNQSVHPF